MTRPNDFGTIAALRNRHAGKAVFVLGTAPHLADLDLALLRDEVTIGVNQLATRAAELNLDYVCIAHPQRLAEMQGALEDESVPRVVVARSALERQGNWSPSPALKGRMVPVTTRMTSPGHADLFSFDLERCAYTADALMLAMHVAVWVGAQTVYLIGVDATYGKDEPTFYTGSPKLEVDVEDSQRYGFPDQRRWLARIHTLFTARGIRLYNAAGTHSKLDVLPRVRLRAAVGRPVVAVTSKTFCGDDYLVDQLRRYFPDVRLNNADGKLSGSALAEFLADADAVILGTEPLTADVMEALPCLRYVSKYGVGLNNIDFSAAKRLAIEITYRKGVNSDSVAELVLALSLMMLRRVDESIQGYRSGDWRKLPGRELAELTVGIVGYGHVGRVVARKFAALGVARLLVNDLVDIDPDAPAEGVPLDYLIAESDLISWHVSMEPQNAHLVDADLIARMKPSSYLVNTSRGELIDETALAAALHSGHLAAAALDVYEQEPDANPILQSAPRLLTTCHIAGSSNRAIKAMGWAAIESLTKNFQLDSI